MRVQRFPSGEQLDLLLRVVERWVAHREVDNEVGVLSERAEYRTIVRRGDKSDAGREEVARDVARGVVDRVGVDFCENDVERRSVGRTRIRVEE